VLKGKRNLSFAAQEQVVRKNAIKAKIKLIRAGLLVNVECVEKWMKLLTTYYANAEN